MHHSNSYCEVIAYLTPVVALMPYGKKERKKECIYMYMCVFFMYSCNFGIILVVVVIGIDFDNFFFFVCFRHCPSPYTTQHIQIE